LNSGKNVIIKWWQKAIIYEIYPRSFMDANGDGIGDLQGITQKLDYLYWLGIDAIWIGPFFESPMVDFGYDITNYKQIDPIFGTLDDFDTLLKKAHELNIKVILDLVPNHTSIDHPWFKESSSSCDNPKADWYYWQDPKNGNPPNNWLCVTGGSAWGWDESRKQYYLHSFHPCQPDLNWNSKGVQEAMKDTLRFWLDKGVDGFRIDMIDWLGKDPQLRDNPDNPKSEEDYAFNSQLHKYSRDWPNLWDFLRIIRSVLDEYPDKVTIGECDYYLDNEELSKYYGSNDLIDLPGNFKLLYKPFIASSIKQFVDSYLGYLSDEMWPNWVIGNHDRPRITSKLGEEKARLAALLLLTLRGTPFMYYGDEIGMHDVIIPADQVQDPWEKTEPGKGRDRCRTPMQWSTDDNAGFSSPNVKLWLPVSNDYKTINVEQQKNNPSSFLNLYRELITYRKIHTSLLAGNYQSEGDVPDGIYYYRRELQDDKHSIVLNFTAEEKEVSLKDSKNPLIILSTFMDQKTKIADQKLFLRPYEGVLIKIN
jgi:alpha-glucosidase